MAGRTAGVLTKFERAELIGARVRSLNAGEVTVLEPSEIPAGGDTHAIAAAELAARCLPLKLRRPLPDGAVDVVDPNMLEHLPFY